MNIQASPVSNQQINRNKTPSLPLQNLQLPLRLLLRLLRRIRVTYSSASTHSKVSVQNSKSQGYIPVRSAQTHAFKPPVTLPTWSLSLSMPPTALSPRIASCLLAVVSPTFVEERRSSCKGVWVSLVDLRVEGADLRMMDWRKIADPCGEVRLGYAVL